VTVPVTVVSSLEENLAKEFVFKFSTPTIKPMSFFPSSDLVASPRVAPMLVAFDQIIDAEAVLKHIAVWVGKKENKKNTVPLKLLGMDDIKAFSNYSFPDVKTYAGKLDIHK
jgi:hypothetical protein